MDAESEIRALIRREAGFEPCIAGADGLRDNDHIQTGPSGADLVVLGHRALGAIPERQTVTLPAFVGGGNANDLSEVGAAALDGTAAVFSSIHDERVVAGLVGEVAQVQAAELASRRSHVR